MQPELQVFLALLLAHLLGDFPFQSRRMVDGKEAYDPRSYLAHGLTHLLLGAGALLVFTDLSPLQPSALAALAVLTLGHVLLDLAKSALIRRDRSFDRLWLFTADQLAHVLIVASAAFVAVRSVPQLDWLALVWREQRDWLLVSAVILIASVFPAGYFIRYLLLPLGRELAEASTAKDPQQELKELSNAGLYLGWLERALLVVAFAAGSYTAIALIVGAKSLARFPEFRSRAFAEYFLIGTLASVAIAALGGWLLRAALAALPP